MRERLVTLGGALLAVLLAAGLLLPPQQPQQPLSRPTSNDEGVGGLAGLKRWLDQNHIAARSLQRRYSDLARLTDSDGGNLLVTALPHTTGPQDREVRALKRWLTDGNDGVMAAAFYDAPPWSTLPDAQSSQPLLQALGYKVSREEYAGGQDEAANPFELKVERTELKPTLDHPVTDDVTAVAVEHHAFTAAPRRVTGLDDQRTALVLLREARSGLPALWQLRVGEGRIWLLAYAQVFDNAHLGRADNARLFANLAHTALGRGGTVIFDDFHHGVSALYDPEAFYSDPRLHVSLGFIALFWLIYALGHNNRMAPVRTRPEPPRLAAHVRSVRDTLARRLTPAAVGDRLLWHFFNDVRRRRHLPVNGEPVWDELARNARIEPERLAALRRSAERLTRRRRVNLIQLNNQIHHIRKRLA